jgi:hypothetical protein
MFFCPLCRQVERQREERKQKIEEKRRKEKAAKLARNQYDERLSRVKVPPKEVVVADLAPEAASRDSAQEPVGKHGSWPYIQLNAKNYADAAEQARKAVMLIRQLPMDLQKAGPAYDYRLYRNQWLVRPHCFCCVCD